MDLGPTIAVLGEVCHHLALEDCEVGVRANLSCQIIERTTAVLREQSWKRNCARDRDALRPQSVATALFRDKIAPFDERRHDPLRRAHGNAAVARQLGKRRRSAPGHCLDRVEAAFNQARHDRGAFASAYSRWVGTGLGVWFARNGRPPVLSAS